MFISKKNNISSVKKLPLIKSIINDQMNNECFDCGSPNPKYISINNAIFLCGNCSKLHKTFPLEISRIINNNLYKLDEKELYYLYFGGNRKLSEFIYFNPVLGKYKSDALYKTKELKNYRYNLSSIVNEKLGIIKTIENYKYMRNNFDNYNFNTLNLRNKYNRKKILYLNGTEDFENEFNDSKYERLSTTNKIPRKFQKRFMPEFEDTYQNHDRISVHNRNPAILLDMDYSHDIMNNHSNKNANSVWLNNYTYAKDNKNKSYGHLGTTTNCHYKNYINNSININNSNNNNFYINQSENDIDNNYNIRNSAHDNYKSFYNKFKFEIPKKYYIPAIVNSSFNLSTFKIYSKPKLPNCAINLKKSKNGIKSLNFKFDNYYTIQNENNNRSKQNKIVVNTRNNLNYANNIRNKYNQIKSKKAQEKKLHNKNKAPKENKIKQILIKSSNNFLESNEYINDSDKVQNLSIIDIDKKSDMYSPNEKKKKTKNKIKKYNKTYNERRNLEKEERTRMELEETRRKEELKKIEEQKKLKKQKNKKKFTKKQRLKLIEEERFIMQQEEIIIKKKKAFENKVIKEEDEEYEQENDTPLLLNKEKNEIEDVKEFNIKNNFNAKNNVNNINNNKNEIKDKNKKNDIVDTFKNSIRNKYKRKKNNNI